MGSLSLSSLIFVVQVLVSAVWSSQPEFMLVDNTIGGERKLCVYSVGNPNLECFLTSIGPVRAIEVLESGNVTTVFWVITGPAGAYKNLRKADLRTGTTGQSLFTTTAFIQDLKIYNDTLYMGLANNGIWTMALNGTAPVRTHDEDLGVSNFDIFEDTLYFIGAQYYFQDLFVYLRKCVLPNCDDSTIISRTGPLPTSANGVVYTGGVAVDSTTRRAYFSYRPGGGNVGHTLWTDIDAGGVTNATMFLSNNYATDILAIEGHMYLNSGGLIREYDNDANLLSSVSTGSSVSAFIPCTACGEGITFPSTEETTPTTSNAGTEDTDVTDISSDATTSDTTSPATGTSTASSTDGTSSTADTATEDDQSSATTTSAFLCIVLTALLF